MNIGNYVHKFWRYLSVAVTMAILLGAGVFVFESLPPRTIVMATGAEGGANYELGIRYREILARAGVELRLQPTTGSLENLRRLRDSKSGVSVGFTQGGTTTKKESPELESLGTISTSRYGSSAAVRSARARRGCEAADFRLALREAAGERWRCK